MSSQVFKRDFKYKNTPRDQIARVVCRVVALRSPAIAIARVMCGVLRTPASSYRWARHVRATVSGGNHSVTSTEESQRGRALARTTKKRDTRRAVDSKRPELTLSGVGDVTFAGRVHCAACHARGTFLYETVISSRARCPVQIHGRMCV